MSFQLMIEFLTILATVTLAISGVLQAARSEMDVLSQMVPVVLRGEVYASAAIIGIVFYLILRQILDETSAILVGMGCIILIRLLSLYWGLRLPRVGSRK